MRLKPVLTTRWVEEPQLEGPECIDKAWILDGPFPGPLGVAGQLTDLGHAFAPMFRLLKDPKEFLLNDGPARSGASWTPDAFSGHGWPPFSDKGVVRLAMILGKQMGVGLHGGHHAGVAQALLNEFPIYGLTRAQIRADEFGGVGVTQLVRMQADARFLGVMLEHLLGGRSRERCAAGWLSGHIPGLFFEDDPQMGGARCGLDPHLGQVDIE